MTTITRRLAEAAAFVALALPAAAAELSLPTGAQRTAEVARDAGSYRMPTGPWADGFLPTETLEGRVTRDGWRIDGQGLTTLQILAPMRAALEEQGYEIVFECEAWTCGGFDFRFATEILAAPAIYVDIADYRFVSAKTPDGSAAVSLLVSRSDSAAYVQIIRVGQAAEAAQTRADAARPAPAAAPAPVPADPGDIASSLEIAGHAVLGDLTFESGSASLGEGPYASLDALAAYLAANPSRQIMFVGHTDATGSLDGNIALSRRRAQSVVTYMTGTLGTDAGQLSAQGVGYLSPVASSLTQEGRDRNRRVEAVLISTE